MNMDLSDRQECVNCKALFLKGRKVCPICKTPVYPDNEISNEYRTCAKCNSKFFAYHKKCPTCGTSIFYREPPKYKTSNFQPPGIRGRNFHQLVNCNKPPEEIIKILINFLRFKKAKIHSINEKGIRATTGSRFSSRFFGGWAVSKNTLPVLITININKISSGSEVDLNFTDNFGLGTRIGMKEKYDMQLSSLLNEFSNVLKNK